MGGQTRVNQHHERLVSMYSHQQLGRMERRQGPTVQQQKKEASLRVTRTTAVLCWEMRRRWLRKAGHGHLKENVLRVLKRPIRQDHLALCLRTKAWWRMIFSELPRPCISYRPLLARREAVAVLNFMNLHCSLVSRRWLQPPRVPPLARGFRAPMRENTTSGTRFLVLAAFIGSTSSWKASSLKRSWAELFCHAASH